MSEPNGYSDEHLVALVVNGEETAFNELSLRYYKKTWQLIHSHINNQTASTDLTQDVFFKVWECLHCFNYHAQFSTWIYRIALNTIKNYFRQRQLHECEMKDHYIFEQENPETQLLHLEFRGKLEHAFLKLPCKLRDCYGLHAIDGNSYEEISNIMKCPVGTVRSRIYRARQMIKAAM